MKKTWQEDVTALFDATGIAVSRPVVASFGKATYEFDKNLKANWLYYAFLAFVRLAAVIVKPKLVATVGVGSALDGIALYETLRPEQIRLIDVNPSVIDVARNNLRTYFNQAKAEVKWGVELGNLCAPLQEASADLIYANIPTLPGPAVRIFTGMNSSSFYDPAWTPNCPVALQYFYLALQYEFLRQAHTALKSDGSALIALGVRTPASMVDVLFTLAGYSAYEAVVLELKEQSQPQAVVPVYARQEQSAGVEFDFYTGVSRNCWGEGLSLANFKETLAPWRVSAQEALSLISRGKKVYHVIALLRGVK